MDGTHTSDASQAKPSHTPEPVAAQSFNEPWYYDERAKVMLGCDGKPIVHAAGPRLTEYAHRVTACVNACAGINPEAVPMLVEALEWIADIADKIYEQDGKFGFNVARTLISISGRASAALALAKGGAK